MPQTCVRKALSGVSTISGAEDDARDATEPRVVFDVFRFDVFVDRVDVRAGILQLGVVFFLWSRSGIQLAGRHRCAE